MKKFIPYILLPLIFLCYSFIPLSDAGNASINNIVVQFITTNEYGNNLYIDNFSIGNQYNYDIAAVSINNIPKDTSYSVNGSSSFSLTPKVSFLNCGKLNITGPVNVTMQINPGNYASTKQISSLNTGQSAEITFDSWTVTPSTGYSLKTFSSYANDQNRANDTINQFSLYLPGTRRNVLFEAYTNASCGPCAANNPYLDAFIVAHFDTLVAIKYHTWWPGSGDPMYQFNISQNTWRTNYYSVNAVPDLNVDGTILHIFPYSPETQLSTPYYARLSKGAPLGLSVVDTRIAGDSVKAVVTLTIYSPLSAGNYRMRLNAVERKVHYSSPPGSNGETDFFDVFRKFFPDSNAGIPIPTTTGVYSYTIKYKHDAAWVDSMIYSAVYVQNENNKEIINCAKARHYAEPGPMNPVEAKNISKPVTRRDVITLPGITVKNLIPPPAGFNFETFETAFPPPGWTLTNPDAGITFRQVNTANGPSLGGSNSILMEFYSYSTTGQMDYLTSRAYNNIDVTDSLKFDWAYAPYASSGYDDRLTVKVSTDGGTTFPFTIFDKAGMQLATSAVTTNPFVPAGPQDWKTFSFCMGNLTGITRKPDAVPSVFALYDNFPNPFNPVTTIRFDIPKNSDVRLNIFDINGKQVMSLVRGELTPGSYSISWDASGYASGIYFYKIEAGTFTTTKKMVLIK